MKLDWDAVRERYEGGRSVRPLVGGSTLTATSSPDAISVSQRLWNASVTRGELQVALDLLGDRPPSTPAVPFSEELRRYYSGGPQVQRDCSRIPNLSAVLLTDLGYLDSAAAVDDQRSSIRPNRQIPSASSQVTTNKPTTT